MSEKRLLVESTPTTLEKQGKRWKGVLARPGQGSSGFYSEDVLREYGPKALAPGAKAFVDHNPERSVRDMIGVYPEGARYEEGVGLVGEIEVFPHWSEFVEAVAPHAGLSIYMLGESDADGNITELIPDRQNGVDLVSYPGLEGSQIVEKLYESAVARSKKIETSAGQPTDNDAATASVETEKKEHNMDELKALIEALSRSVAEKFTALEEKVDSVVTLSEQATQAAADKTDAFQVADEVSKAVAEAKLPEEGRKRVIESVKAGNTVTDAVTAEVAYVKAITESIKATVAETGAQGRVVEAAGDGGFPEFRSGR